MRRLIAVVVIVAVTSLSLVAGRALARTPTPTPTATATPVASAAADFDIFLWVDARQSWEPVVAKIGDVVCGGETQSPVSPPDSGVIDHHVRVQSDASIPGCGTPGAIVTFLVGGRQADRTAQWLPGEERSLTLLVGPPFARFWGDADLQLKTGNERLVPFVGEKACGYQENSWQGAAPAYGYGLVVYSHELQAGCGVEGAQISFKLVDEQGNVLAVAEKTGVWRVWDGTTSTFQSLNLTMVPVSSIRVGSTGTGDSQESGGPPVGVVALGLALAGLTTLGAGTVLRKRAGR